MMKTPKLTALAIVSLFAACGHSPSGPRATEPQPLSESSPTSTDVAPASSDAPTRASGPACPMTILPEDDLLSDAARVQTAPHDFASVPFNATREASGLASRILRCGTGTRHPGPSDQVTVHYAGWNTRGRLFDSSVPRRRPATFRPNQLIPGWTEGLQLMVEGEIRRFWIPEALAYPGRSGDVQGDLIFDVSLIHID